MNSTPHNLFNGKVDDTVPSLLLKAADAAKALAISQRTLWTLTNSGEIDTIKIGRAVRYEVEELRAFIERQRRN